MNSYKEKIHNILKTIWEEISQENLKEVFHYYNHNEEWIAMDLLVAYLNKSDYIWYKLSLLINDFFTHFPADGIYIQIEPVHNLLNKIRNAKVYFKP